MKKAKEYAAEYRANPTDKVLAKIAVQFLREIPELIKARRVSTPAGHIAILEEQDRKWKAFARHFENIIRPDGFEMLFKDKFPEAHALWRGPLRNLTNGLARTRRRGTRARFR